MVDDRALDLAIGRGEALAREREAVGGEKGFAGEQADVHGWTLYNDR